MHRLPTRAALAASFIVALGAAPATHHWSYAGNEGPAHWGELDAAFTACGQGKRQSPVAISSRDAQRKDLPPLVFRYQPGALHIADNGHTIEVETDPGNALLIGRDRYELVQFHFHRPSEERIDGRRFPMEAHLVHRNAAGNLAVVSIPLREGEENALLATLWSNLPAGGHDASPPGVKVTPAALLPDNRGYFTYSGSLTTPPCSEGVRWFVLQSPVTVSHREVATFAERYPDDARPLQPLNGRQVLASN